MERTILGYKCTKCGTVHYPNRTLCKKCHNNEFEAFPLPNDGKLLTFSKLHNLAVDFDVADITLGIVELSNGNRVMGQVKIESPKIGMKVVGKVEQVRGGELKQSFGFIFYPA